VLQGIALVTENRQDEGLLLPLSVRANLTLARLRPLSRRGFLRSEAETSAARTLVSRLGIKCASVEQPVEELSGGNQQKVVLGRWLDRDFDVLLCDEPTRGVDVGARAEIHALLTELARAGKAILVVSSEIEELRALCDRIVVLSAGRVAGTFEREAFDPDALLAAALRHHTGAKGAA
jgi:ribose transport system ATP-binding protein